MNVIFAKRCGPEPSHEGSLLNLHVFFYLIIHQFCNEMITSLCVLGVGYIGLWDNPIGTNRRPGLGSFVFSYNFSGDKVENLQETNLNLKKKGNI